MKSDTSENGDYSTIPADMDNVGAVTVDQVPELRFAAYAETIQVSSMAARRADLSAINNIPGAQRRKFERSISTFDLTQAAITVAYGRGSVSLTANGSAISDERGRPAYFPGGLHEKLRTALPGSAPLNKIANGIRVPCGVCLIIAGGGRGKTPLAHALASAGVESYSTVRVGEPLAGYASTPIDAAYNLAHAMLKSPDVVLDSIKDLLSSGGSAMKSGLSRDALVSISGWASAACDAGCTIYIPVNPSTGDPEVLALLKEVSRSNATMTITDVDSNGWEYHTRTGEGLPRENGTFSMYFDPSGQVRLKSSSTNKQTDASTRSRLIVSNVSVSNFDQAARRAIVQVKD